MIGWRPPQARPVAQSGWHPPTAGSRYSSGRFYGDYIGYYRDCIGCYRDYIEYYRDYIGFFILSPNPHTSLLAGHGRCGAQGGSAVSGQGSWLTRTCMGCN